jgi:DHA1 family bicyclomycin/chloramphenicol resistance-like MFS transporter
MSFEASQLPGGKRLPGTREMVAMLAGLMALNAFGIAAMIPALPDIGTDLDVATENGRQLVVVAYFIGFGSTQLIWGPLADRFGRKPVLAAGISLYTAFALLCGLAASFPLLIAGRVAMGASAAVTRVLVVAMVRDLFESEAMARVMSLVFMTFLLVPVLAPSVGQAILLVGPWRAIFLVLAAYGVIMLLWSGLRLPETLHPEYRRSLAWRDMGGAMWETIREPQSRGYTLALAVTFGGLTAYIA